MIQKYPYIFGDKVFSHVFCDEIINTFKKKKQEAAITGLGLKKEFRDSDVSLHDEAHFVYKQVNPLIAKMNKQLGWNVQIDYPETFQFTKYGLNQHYHWHHDTHSEPYSGTHKDILLRNKTRKISISICLSDPEEYEGGEFMLDLRNTNAEKPTYISHPCMKNKGSVVVFLSHLWHTVKPVTSGTRYSSVLWYVGNPYV